MKEFQRYRTICHFLSPVAGTGAKEMQHALQEDDWPGLLGTAGRHFVTTLLAGRLKRKALFEQLPEEVGGYLEKMKDLNQQRNDLLRAELLNAITALNDIEVQPIVLKGAINLVSNQYPGCEDRIIGDLDLVVPAARIEECFRLLASGQYHPHTEFGPEELGNGHHHAPPLLHASLPVSIELHHRILGRRTEAFLNTQEAWDKSISSEKNGVSFRLLDPTSRLVHTFTHTQLQDQQHKFRRLFLRPLCEFVDQRASFDAEVDWGLISLKLGKRNLWVLETYLLCARELFGQQEPENVPIGIRARARMPSIRGCAGSQKLRSAFVAIDRLKRLPRRLATPSWYPAKVKAMWNGAPL